MEARFRTDLKEWEEFGQAGKRNYDILEKRSTMTKGKESGRCFKVESQGGQPIWRKGGTGMCIATISGK